MLSDIELPLSTCASFVDLQNNCRSVRIAQLLGVSHRHRSLFDDNESGSNADSGNRSDVMLNLSSVNRLQCDLIAISEELNDLLSSLASSSSSSCDIIYQPVSVKFTERIATLSNVAAQLLLHVSCFAPLANSSDQHVSDSALHSLANEVLL